MSLRSLNDAERDWLAANGPGGWIDNMRQALLDIAGRAPIYTIDAVRQRAREGLRLSFPVDGEVNE